MADTTTSYFDATTVNFTAANTTASDEKPAGLYIVYNILIVAAVVVMMFSMGTNITLDDVRLIARRPVGPFVGLLCQCIIMPACCCGYALLLGLADNLALGMVIVGCCPGGSISNFVTYWTKSDISLR